MSGMTNYLCHPDPFGNAQGKVKRRISLSRGLINLGTDPSLLAQDDRLFRHLPQL
jgi:hypothetical protein